MSKLAFVLVLLFSLSFSSLQAQTNFKAGDAVEVFWYGSWFKAQVLEVNGGKYKIHYEGYGSSSDE